MRRTEFEVKDEKAFEELMAECEYGTLGLIDDDEPYCVPVNFVWHEGAIYFHGALEGRKAEIFKQNLKTAFSVVKPYSLIPSYFSGSSACTATQYFISAHILGRVETAQDAKLKCAALNAMMQKLQPDGGYEQIDETNPIYTKMLAQTGIYRLTPSSYSLKIKAAQNLIKERKEALIQKLKERGGALDIATAQAILKA